MTFQAISSGYRSLSVRERQQADTFFETIVKQPPSVVFEHVYSRDDRNTDNAWIETTVINVHDHSGFLKEVDVKEVAWRTVHRGLKLQPRHVDFLLEIAAFHNAALV